MTELEALTNATTGTGLQVYEYMEHDKRRTIKKYFVNMGTQTVSPKLDYDQMNAFLLGWHKAIKVNQCQGHKQLNT